MSSQLCTGVEPVCVPLRQSAIIVLGEFFGVLTVSGQPELATPRPSQDVLSSPGRPFAWLGVSDDTPGRQQGASSSWQLAA
jgi:hypothetical protein